MSKRLCNRFTPVRMVFDKESAMVNALTHRAVPAITVNPVTHVYSVRAFRTRYIHGNKFELVETVFISGGVVYAASPVSERASKRVRESASERASERTDERLCVGFLRTSFSS